MKKTSLEYAKAAYVIEEECLRGLAGVFDEEQFSKAVGMLSTAERI